MFAASAATKTAKMALAAKITPILSPRTTRYTKHAALKTYDVWSDVRSEVWRKKKSGLISVGAVTRAGNQMSASRRVIPVRDSSILNNHNQYPTTTNAARADSR